MPAGAGRARGGGRDASDPPFFFEGIESPNGTIFPDALLDVVMPFLTPTEWKVCSYVVRRTFGWKKASDRISLEQICHGIARRDGTRLDYGTQLDRKTAIKALRGLEAKGVIVARRNYSDARGFEPTTYGLRFRGQQPTRTLVEKLPQGEADQVENFPLGEGDDFPEGPGGQIHQASVAPPPALVDDGPLQPTPRPTNRSTSEKARKRTTKGAPDEGPAGETREVADVVDIGQQAGEQTRVDAPSSRARATPRGPARQRSGEQPGIGVPVESVETELRPAEEVAPDAAVWTTVLARLQQQMTAANYQTWLAETRPLGRRGSTLVVGAPSGFVREWLQTRFRLLVRRVLQDAAPHLDDVTFEVAGAPRPADRA